MKLLIQRVNRVKVEIKAKTFSEIDKGLLLFLGIDKGDSKADVEHLAYKCINMRIFEDDNGKMNLSVLDMNGEILLVPQFTLSANCEKGHRPSFDSAASPEIAKKLYEEFAHQLQILGIKPKLGSFGSLMLIDSVNYGPATFFLQK